MSMFWGEHGSKGDKRERIRERKEGRGGGTAWNDEEERAVRRKGDSTGGRKNS